MLLADQNRDITSLINRAFYLGLTATPYVITTWAAPAIASDILDHSTWRWGYGIFAITTPLICLPLLYFLFKSQIRAKQIISSENPQVNEEEQSVSTKGPMAWFWDFDGKSSCYYLQCPANLEQS